MKSLRGFFRGFLCGGIFFLFIGFFWAFFDPLLSFWEVSRLDGDEAGKVELEGSLSVRGRGALWALRWGLRNLNPSSRLLCAKIMAGMEEEEGEEILVKALREGGKEAIQAEGFLHEVWQGRYLPKEKGIEELVKTIRSSRKALPNEEKRLDKILEENPRWADGFLARARYHYRQRNLPSATRDLLRVLIHQPNRFEAIAMLARCLVDLDMPELALDFFERALAINPLLGARIAKEVEAVRRSALIERERKLRERKSYCNIV